MLGRLCGGEGFSFTCIVLRADPALDRTSYVCINQTQH